MAPMGAYTVQDIQRMLGMPRDVVAGLIAAGFITPARGKRREYRFTFQDLIIMKAAKELSAARIGTKRIARSLQILRDQLPAELPLSGLRISAAGNRARQRIIVRQGTTQWQPDSGQYLLDFEVAPGSRSVSFLTPSAQPKQGEHAPRGSDAHEWFAYACELEDEDAQRAAQAYARAIELDTSLVAAYTNLGRLQHAQKQLDAAQRTYLAALERCEADALLLFNFGVLLEDRQRPEEANAAYRGALKLDPKFADAHYNLALLRQQEGATQEALQHLNAYRRLQQ